MNQLDLNLSGKELKEVGMKKALDSAERLNPGWASKAFDYLKDYVYCQPKEFLAEDVREASKGMVPEAPSARAWGAIIVKAAKAGLIRRIGYRPVKNAKARCTPASVWMRV